MPAFRTGHPRARLRRNANLALAAGWNTVPWTFADYDDVAGWDGVTDYVLDRGGLWQLGATVSFASTGASGSPRARWSVNGGIVAEAIATPVSAAVGMSILATLELDQADVVHLDVQRSTTAAGTMTFANSWLEIIRIGPVRYTGN